MQQLENTEFTPAEYVLLESEYVKNSPYRLEGNEEVVLGIPAARNLPYRYNITHQGKARKIRLVIGCETPFVDEQMKLGEPSWSERKVTPEELQALRIENGVVVAVLPEVAAYIDLLPHNSSSSTPIPKGRPIRQLVKKRDEVSEIKNDLDIEMDFLEAGNLIKSWDLAKMKDVLRLRYKTPAGDMTEDKARLKLISILKNEKNGISFILSNKEEMKEDDKVQVTVTKAIEYGIISLSTKNKVSMRNQQGKYSPVVNINDESTPDGKFNRFCEHLRTDGGKVLLASIASMVDEEEKVKK